MSLFIPQRRLAKSSSSWVVTAQAFWANFDNSVRCEWMSHQAGISQMSCPTCPEPCASFSKARLDSILFPFVVPKPGGGLFLLAFWTINRGTFPTCRCFVCDILIGALSLVKIIPIVEKPDKLDTHVAFSFRRGKRLLSRYPPGHVAGIEMFFKFHKQRVDQDLQPKLIVSSLLGPPAEVWILRYDGWQDVPGWKQMPDDLKGYLARMLCVQFADTLKHANLKERWWMVTCHAWRTFVLNFAPTIFYMLYRSYVI